MDAAARADFIRANTEVLPVPLVPEIRLHLAHEALPIWQKTEDELGEIGLPPPFWAFAWAGGQALARHVLDNPEIVRARKIIDLASGSGLVAIAALKAGAASVLATDIDAFAVAAIGMNHVLNGTGETFRHPSAGWGPAEDTETHQPERDASLRWHDGICATSHNLLADLAPDCDVILVGDLFYEKHLAERLMAWLVEARRRGITCLIGDPGRSYLPKDRLVKVADYEVPVTRELEDAEIKKTAVWRLAP